MSAFWDGFLTGLQAGPRRFFAPMVWLTKGLRRVLELRR
jgi:hypothetical protein